MPIEPPLSLNFSSTPSMTLAIAPVTPVSCTFDHLKIIIVQKHILKRYCLSLEKTKPLYLLSNRYTPVPKGKEALHVGDKINWINLRRENLVS